MECCLGGEGEVGAASVVILCHFPRSQAVIALTAPFVLWAFKSPPQVLLLGILAGGVIFVRHISELRRDLHRGLK